MDKEMNMEEFRKQAADLLRAGKPLTGTDGVFTPLIKQVLEASLEGELDTHLKQEKPLKKNRRNGHTRKNLKSSLGTFEISTPRDRDGSFTPKTIEKRQRQLPGDLEDKIIGLYGLGMSYSDIQSHLQEMYGLSISDGTLNNITDRVIPAIREWQSRILEPVYAIIWMDAMHFKIREEGKIRCKAIYTVLGVNIEGKKEVLGLYLGDNESATFWLDIPVKLTPVPGILTPL